jgi:alpha-1,6-mannosyltransferase
MAAGAEEGTIKEIRESPLRLWVPLATALVYLLAFTIPYWLPAHYLHVQDELFQFAARQPWRGVLFYAALAAVLGLYLYAYRRLWRRPAAHRPGILAIGLWTALFCLLLIPVQPITSSDVYGYAFQGRIVAVLGQNPFVHLYRDFAGDPFYFIVTFRHLPASTGYGPLWILVDAALGWLARNGLLVNLLLFKTLAAGLHLAASLLVYAILGRTAPERRLAGTLFYAWNPLLLYELVVNAHNDAALAALALLGFFFLSRRRGLLAVPCLAAAALVKPVALLWLPPVALWLLARERDWPARARRALWIAALALLPAVLAYAPFWQGADTFQGLLAQSNISGNSLPALLIQLGRALWPVAGAGPDSVVVQGVKLLTAVLFAPFYLWQMWLAWRAGAGASLAGLVRVSFDLMLFYLLFVGFQFWPWYLTWLLVPAALLPAAGPAQLGPWRRRLSLALCASTPLLYFPFGWQWARQHLPPWSVALLAALPLLGLALWAIARYRRPAEVEQSPQP